MLQCGVNKSPSRAVALDTHEGHRTMTIRTVALAALASIVAAAAASAGERIDLTPPLYREMARETAAVRPASELATTPSVVARAAEPRTVVEASAAAER